MPSCHQKDSKTRCQGPSFSHSAERSTNSIILEMVVMFYEAVCKLVCVASKRGVYAYMLEEVISGKILPFTVPSYAYVLRTYTIYSCVTLTD